MRRSKLGVLLATVLLCGLTTPAGLEGQEAHDRPVGIVEMVVDGREKVFEVREGPIREGFVTGYGVQPRGEELFVSTSLHGWDRATDEEIVVSVAFWKESLEHMCDPFANRVRYRGDDLRPGSEPSETCPPPEDGGRGGLRLHINLTEASMDEEEGTVHVAGTFAGPLGRGDEAPRVTEGRFEAILRPMEELGG